MLKKLVLITILVLALGQKVLADAPPLKAEQFSIVTPSAGEQVAGITKISFKAADPDLATIPYEVQILDAACKTKVGVVSRGNMSSDSVAEISWDSELPLSDGSSPLAKGNYCVRVCVTLRLSNEDANVCGSRLVSLVSKSGAPQFTSVPTGDVLITDSNWSFKLLTLAPSNLSLKIAPSFLKINNGLLQVVSPRDGVYEVVVAAQASGLETTDQFRLLVDTKASFVSGGDTQSVSDIVFLAPQSGAIFTGSESLVRLALGDNDGLKTLKLEYSIDGKSWTKFAETDLVGKTSSEVSQRFDVSKLQSGKYYVRAQVTDSKDIVTEKLAPQITVAGSQPTNDAQSSVPLIINIQPADTTNITELKPLISGGLVPTYASKIDVNSFKIQLDGEDILAQCKVLTTKFECYPKQDLILGKHQLNVEVSDTTGQVAKREWIFSVVQTILPPVVSTPVATATELPRGVIIVAVIVCCLALIFILVPWLLYFIWRSRTRRANPEVVTTVPYSPIQPVNEIIVDVPYFNPAPQVIAQPSPIVTTEVAEPVKPPVSLVAEQPLMTATPLEPAGEPPKPAESESIPDWLKEKPPTPLTSIPTDQLGSFGYAQKEEK